MLARTHIAAFALALAVSAALTPLVRALAHRYNLFDLPDERKVHTRPIPRLGGIAIALAFYAPVAGLLIYFNKFGVLLLGHERFLWALYLGGGTILALGVYDDIHGADHRLKFLVQFAVAGMLYGLGYGIDRIVLPGIGPIEFGILSLPVTLIWVVGIINAVNLIDGLDGLASGVSFFAVTTLFVSGLLDGSALVCLLTASMAGAVVGFLFYNFNPATIFMGDSGSMFVGYVLAAMSIVTTTKSATLFALAVPLLALGLPIFDTLFAMGRRMYTGRPVFSADRGHLHHRLLDLGLTQRQAVLLLYGVCALLAATALVIRTTHNFLAGGVLFLVGTLVFAAVHMLRFREVFAQRNRRRLDALQRRVHEKALDQLRAQGRRIREAADLGGAWSLLKDCARLLGLTRMTLTLHIRPGPREDLQQELRWVSSNAEDVEARAVRLVVPLMNRRFIYGELTFVHASVPSVDAHRRALMYLMAEYVVEFLERSYAEEEDRIFTVHRHPGMTGRARVRSEGPGFEEH